MINIEVMNMYFSEEDLERDLFRGTAHIRLKDYNIDLKGIYFKKKKNFWLVSLPSMPFIHEETKKRMRYPFFTFVDREKNREFQIQIKQLLYKELETRLMQKTLQLTT